MNDDTRVRDFLDRMANEIEVAPVDWRPPVRRARRRRTVAMLLVAIAVVMIIPAVSLRDKRIDPNGIGSLHPRDADRG